MTESDLEEILAIEQQSFAAPWSLQMFRETICFPHSLNFVIRKRVDNTLVGYANFYLVVDEVQVLNIAVDPIQRNLGYGKALLVYAIEELRNRHASDFYLEVREGNEGARHLYRTLGFVQIGRRKKYYPENNEDAIVMHLKVGT
jgi:[ribosomal protein S18]-alanine N-acetyltransferase